MESWHSAPLPGYEAVAAAGMTKVNTYLNIRLADLVGAEPIVHQDNMNDTGVSLSRAEDTEDTVVEPPELVTVRQPATMNEDIPVTRTLKDWIDDIHGRGGKLSEDGSWRTAPSPTATAGCGYTPPPPPTEGVSPLRRHQWRPETKG